MTLNHYWVRKGEILYVLVEIQHNLQNTHKYSELSKDGMELACGICCFDAMIDETKGMKLIRYFFPQFKELNESLKTMALNKCFRWMTSC